MAQTPLKPIDKRHKILKMPQIFHSTTTKVYDAIGHGQGYRVNVHANCVCNEVVSLHNRHLVDRTDIKFNPTLWQAVSSATEKYYPKYVQPSSYDDIIKNYTGNKKRLYRHACVQLRTSGLERRHGVVKMFVKPDRIPLADIGDKDPRAIQYRSPVFNLAMLSYIHPFEAKIYPNVDYGVVSGTRVIVKGLNNYERAELFLNKVDHFRNPLFLLLDHSRFDSTINRHHLLSTHRKYQRAFRSKQLGKILRVQLKNKGYTKGGIKYRTTATRMSGDPDTGCGNSVVNGDCIHGFLRLSGITKYDYILDGDDSVVIIEKGDRTKCDFTLFEKMGFKTKYEITTELDQVEFCQSKIILAEQPVFSRNPFRAVSHTVLRKRYPRKTIGRWVAAVGECERACNLGVPVLQAYGTKLADLTRNYFVDDDLRFRWGLHSHGKNRVVTDDARLSFYLAWGVPPEAQTILEEHNWTSNVYFVLSERLPYTKYAELACTTRRVQAIEQSSPESSGGCWWNCSSSWCQRY